MRKVYYIIMAGALEPYGPIQRRVQSQSLL